MRRRILRYLAVAACLLLPFAIRMLYVQVTALPPKVVLATGPADGRYSEIIKAVQQELELRHPDIEIVLEPTNGSLENLQLLLDGKADFALYQPETESILKETAPSGHDEIAFVTNVYSEVAHFIVPKESEIQQPDDLRKEHRVAIGKPTSGDYAMSRVLLKHFGIDEESIKKRQLNYLEIEQALENGQLDAAFLTAGIHAPVFKTLLSKGDCRLIAIPHTAALSRRRLSITPYSIPAGFYRSGTSAVPAADVETVALRAQLLTRTETSGSLVKEVAGIILSKGFIAQQHLSELFAGGHEFARNKPEFTPHPATADVFDPHLRPLLDSEFVEATEGMRSFVVSILIAGYLAFRWYRNRRVRSKEHRLDQHIRSMLAIERKQLDLDQTEGSADLEALQNLLDEVTALRQKALAEITAHELNEDRAADSFLEMAHALSDKINAKISRQRLDKRFEELATALSGNHFNKLSPPGRETASKPKAQEAE